MYLALSLSALLSVVAQVDARKQVAIPPADVRERSHVERFATPRDRAARIEAEATAKLKLDPTDVDTLYHNDGEATFTDVTVQAEIHEPTFPFLGWGAGLVDLDNDGRRDIFVANGHVYPDVDKYDWGMTWAQRSLVFRNRDGRRFDLVPAATGSGLAILKSARGAAFGDVDNDGDVDVVLNNIDATPTLLINRGAGDNHWLQVKVVRGGKVPRDGIGTVIVCTVGGQRLRGRVASGESYQSQSDLRVHFGLGKATRIDKLEAYWPDGTVQAFSVNAIDRVVTVSRTLGTAK